MDAFLVDWREAFPQFRPVCCNPSIPRFDNPHLAVEAHAAAQIFEAIDTTGLGWIPADLPPTNELSSEMVARAWAISYTGSTHGSTP